MSEDIEKIVQNAESCIKIAESEAEGAARWGPHNLAVPYLKAVYNGIKAVYEQNKAIIMLLRDKK